MKAAEKQAAGLPADFYPTWEHVGGSESHSDPSGLGAATAASGHYETVFETVYAGRSGTRTISKQVWVPDPIVAPPVKVPDPVVIAPIISAPDQPVIKTPDPVKPPADPVKAAAKRNVSTSLRLAMPKQAHHYDVMAGRPEWSQSMGRQQAHTRAASSPNQVRERDPLRCKERPKDNRPKGGGGGSFREFIPWCR